MAGVVRGWLYFALPLALGALGACNFHVEAAGPATGDDDAAIVDAPPAPWLTGFAQRKSIDLQGRSTPLVGFVASIAVDADPDLVGATALTFTAADGQSPLPAELVTFDPASGQLDAWVTTTLAAGGPTRIFLYYGTGSAPLTASPWTPRYAGVWHMARGGTNNDTAADSTLLHDAKAIGTEIPLSVPGMVGEAREYDGSNDSMSIADPPDGSLDFGISSLTVGLWVRVEQSAGPYDMPLYRGGANATNGGFDFELGTGGWVAGFCDGQATQITPSFGQETALLHAWHYLVAQSDRTTNVVRTFVDGVQVTELAFPRGSINSSTPVKFGDSTYKFRGRLDEIRIIAEALSPDWIAAEYANAAQRAQFVTFGPAEQQP